MTTYKLRDSTTGRYYPLQFQFKSEAINYQAQLSAAARQRARLQNWEIETVTDEDRDAESTDHEERDLT